MFMKSDRSVKDHVEYLHDKVKKLLALNLSETEIIKALQEDDVDEFYAKTLIENVQADKTQHKDFWKLLVMGIVTILAGLTVNYFSYTIAANNGSLSR